MPYKIEGLILVLGSPNKDDGELFNIAKERCMLAYKEYQNHSGWKILLTGGYGDHFNKAKHPHAEYLKQYLLQKGVKENDIVEFAESRSTIEDARLSKKIVKKYGARKILIVTSDYHFDRADYLFNREYRDSDIRICFSLSKTNRDLCGIDLDSQIQHEKKSLNDLKKLDSQTSGSE